MDKWSARREILLEIIMRRYENRSTMMTSNSLREAKTMLEAPHEYVVRTPENEAAYVALFILIGENGVQEKWGRYKYKYWYPGDGWKYWRMTNDIRYSRV
jgi:hypothetical protein